MDLATYLKDNDLTQAAFANALKKHGTSVTAQAVKTWADRRSGPSPKMFDAIEAATAGKVTRQDLRPDIFNAAPPKSKKRARAA
jgi:DNA-binding transcriptional regulator YdaS (Cro superfamily)